MTVRIGLPVEAGIGALDAIARAYQHRVRDSFAVRTLELPVQALTIGCHAREGGCQGKQNKYSNDLIFYFASPWVDQSTFMEG